MGKIIAVLLFGAFAAAGIGLFAFSGVPMISGWYSAKSWQPVQAELLSHQLQRNQGDDSVTYSAKARYHYDYFGQRYLSDQVNFAGGSDNIGSYHQDMNSRLASISRSRHRLTVWVNPDKPSQAVIDREMRWGLLLVKSLFLFIFGGIGLGGLFLIYRFRNAGKVLADAEPDKPWTHFSEWNRPTILSNAKTGNRVLLGIMLFWNAVSLPLVFSIVEPVRNGEYLVLLGLLFPALGAYLFWAWYKSHRSFKRTGLMPLTLNPYPASIGGQAGGVIRLTSRIRGLSKTAKLTLRNIHTYSTGSGDDRKTQERTIYEKSMVPSIVYTEKETEIRFCFDLDESLSVSEPPLEMPRKTWRVSFTATTEEGLKIERDYDDIPVFATSKVSTITDAQAYESVSVATLDAQDKLVESVLDLQADDRGHRLFYPAYRNKSMLLLLLVGLIFFGVGLAIPQLIFNIIFSLIGALLVMIGVYAFANSLEVRIGAEGISAQRSLFGYDFKPQFVPSYSFKAFEKEVSSTSTSGKKTTTYYKIVAYGNEGEKAIVAERLAGLEQADAAIERLSALLAYS